MTPWVEATPFVRHPDRREEGGKQVVYLYDLYDKPNGERLYRDLTFDEFKKIAERLQAEPIA